MRRSDWQSLPSLPQAKKKLKKAAPRLWPPDSREDSYDNVYNRKKSNHLPHSNQQRDAVHRAFRSAPPAAAITFAPSLSYPCAANPFRHPQPSRPDPRGFRRSSPSFVLDAVAKASTSPRNPLYRAARHLRLLADVSWDLRPGGIRPKTDTRCAGVVPACVFIGLAVANVYRGNHAQEQARP